MKRVDESAFCPLKLTGQVTAGTIDASAAGAPFIMRTTTATVNTASATIIGSPFYDELTGSDGDDIITAGDGNDRLNGRAGADTLTGGNGADWCYYDAIDQFGDVITDFTPGTDRIGLGSGILDFGGITGIEGGLTALTAADFETGRTTVISIAAGDANKIVRLSSAQKTLELSNPWAPQSRRTFWHSIARSNEAYSITTTTGQTFLAVAFRSFDSRTSPRSPNCRPSPFPNSSRSTEGFG